MIRNIERRVRETTELDDIDDVKAHAAELSDLLDAYELLHEKIGVRQEAERDAVASVLDQHSRG